MVVNVAATEPPSGRSPATRRPGRAAPRRWRGRRGAAAERRCTRYAAFTAGCSFVDFTPSTGAAAAGAGRARAGAPACRTPGSDGKTGETLVKSVLAPMFAMRDLRVRSWSGINLLGGGDGANLADPAANAAKVASKQRGAARDARLRAAGPHAASTTCPDLGDLKTAWDPITFDGLPRHPDAHGVHLARLRLGAGRAAGARPGPAHRRRARRPAASGPLAELASSSRTRSGDGAARARPTQWRRAVRRRRPGSAAVRRPPGARCARG